MLTLASTGGEKTKAAPICGTYLALVHSIEIAQHFINLQHTG